MISDYGIKPTSFVKLTEELDILLTTVPNAARLLYGWMRRQAKPGTPIEVCLDHFVAISGFSIQWIKKSLQALVDLGLVAIVQKYGARWARVAVFEHLISTVETSENEDKSFKSDDKSLRNEDKSFNKPASNPLPSFPVTEKSENYKPGSGFSDFVSQEKELIRTLPQTQPIQPDPLVNESAIGEDHFAAAAKIEAAISKPIPPTLKKMALEASLQVIEDAIAALQEAKTREKGVKDEVAFLVKAIQCKYKPRRSEQGSTTNLTVFGQWFDWARAKGIAAASMRSDSGILVMMGSAWVKFEDAIARHPIA